MTPADRFLDLATSPLSDNAELQVAARHALQETIDINSPDEVSLEQAAAALARADARPRRARWRIALLLATLIVSLPFLGQFVWQFLQARGALRQLTSLGTLVPAVASKRDPLARHAASLPPDQRLLLYGNREAANDAARWQALWDSERENPAYLAEYAGALSRVSKQLPPEILAAAEQIDPDNGWYQVLLAASHAEQALEDNPAWRSNTRSKAAAGPREPRATVKDETEFRAALDSLRAAAAKPACTNHQATLLRQRIPLLPPRTDFASQFPAIVYLADLPAMTLPIRKLGQLFSVAARRCGENGDPGEFRKLVSQWEWLVRSANRDAVTLVDVLIAKALLTNPLEEFAAAAEKLGLPEEAGRFTALHTRLETERNERKTRSSGTMPLEHLARERGALLAGLALPIGASLLAAPPPLTESDLRPGRLADHAFLARSLTPLAWLVLGLSAGLAALHRFRHGPLVRALSGRMTDLLHASDQAWILIGGILLPLVWHVVVTRYSPWTAREWSLGTQGFLPVSGQITATLLLLLLAPVVIARARLGRRGKVAGLGCRRQWIGWAALAACAVALPLCGAITPRTPAPGLLLVTAGLLLAFAQLWLLVACGRTVFGRARHALRRATTARLLGPAWLAGMLLLALALPLLHAEERRWIQRDRLFEISAETPGFSRYEWQVTEGLRAQVSELLDTVQQK